MGLTTEGYVSQKGRPDQFVAGGERRAMPHALILTERDYILSDFLVATDPQYVPSSFATERYMNPDSPVRPDKVKNGMLIEGLIVNIGNRAFLTGIDTVGNSSTQSVQINGHNIPLLTSDDHGEPTVVNRQLFDSITGVANLPLGSWGPDAIMTQHLHGNRPSFRDVPPEEVTLHMKAEAELMRGFRQDGHIALVGMNEGWSLVHKGARSVLRFPHKQVVRYPEDARVNAITANDVIAMNNKRNPDEGISQVLAERLQNYVDGNLLDQFTHGGISVATNSALVMVLPRFTPEEYGEVDAYGRNKFFESFIRPLTLAIEGQLALQHSTVFNSDLQDARAFIDQTYQTGKIDWNMHDQLYDKRSPFSWRPFDPETAEQLSEFYERDQVRYPAAYSLGIVFTDAGAIVAADTKLLRGDGGPVELMLGAKLDRSSSFHNDTIMGKKVDSFYRPRIQEAYDLAG